MEKKQRLAEERTDFKRWATQWFARLKAGGPINYVDIRQGGTVRLIAEATVFDDLRTMASEMNFSPEGAAPALDTLLGGTKLWWFGPNADAEMYFNVELPHFWKAGSTIYPHVHWVPSATGTAGHVVKWSLEFTWQNKAGVFGVPLTISGTAHTPADSALVTRRHYVTDLEAITGTAKEFSSILVCRIFRDADNVADTYTGNAGLLAVDFHIEIDSLGSELLGSKEAT